MVSRKTQSKPGAIPPSVPIVAGRGWRFATSEGDGKGLAAIRRALLRWYDRHRRDLPWRKTRDPYRIWLSEIMLQQTRVAAVLDHYRIFLERFPNVQALAAASEDAVLAAWSGLGYYRRARMLHRAAQQIDEQWGDGFPQTSAALLTLPGIGRYTAAAIASIAFDEPVAVVDGNVERVLQRFTGINLTAAQTWQLAQALLASSRPGDFNQAMMELGATVCVPREPRCPGCPVRKWCITRGAALASAPGDRRSAGGRASRRSGRAGTPGAPQKKKEIWCALLRRNGRGNGRGKSVGNCNGKGTGEVRLVQRPHQDSLMPGMWELPQSSAPPRPLPASAHWRTFRHSITVTDYTVHVLRNTPLTGKPPGAKGKWVAIDRIAEIPITGLTRKILKAGGII